ncbi:MAG: TPM domain-containing protein [Pirellulales bacterium]
MSHVHRLNAPLFTLDPSHPARRFLNAFLECRANCVGQELKGPEWDQEWFSRMDGRKWAFSGLMYEAVSLDVELDGWLNDSPIITAAERDTLQIIPHVSQLLNECEAACLEADNDRVPSMIGKVRGMFALWQEAILDRLAYKRAELNAPTACPSRRLNTSRVGRGFGRRVVWYLRARSQNPVALARHSDMAAHTTLSPADSAAIHAAVAAAEARTSAEIKVVVVRYCWSDIRVLAQRLFVQNQLDRTQGRNAVMILLVLVNREFLVFGDQGIHEKVGSEFWLQVRDAIREKLAAGELAHGVCAGVERVGEQLARYFPRAADDINEISDEVIHEE